MSGPEDGKYTITLAMPPTSPAVPIGANYDPSTLSYIMFGARNNVWTVSKAESGNYTLVLEEEKTPWFSRADGSNLFVGTMPTPTEWVIQPQAHGTYLIQDPTPILPPKVWTSFNPYPRPLALAPYEPDRSPEQLWKFNRR